MKKKKHKYIKKPMYLVTNYSPKNRINIFPIRLTKHNYKHVRLMIRLKRTKYTIKLNWINRVYIKYYKS